MNKTIKLALAASMVLGATSAFATNGTSLIGYGAKSRGMGGTGVAQFQGAESGFNNPALVGFAEGTEVSIGGTYFKPDVTVKGTIYGGESYSSDAGASMIPAVSTADKVNESFGWGLALYGVGGMGVDLRNSAAVGSNDNLMLMRFAVPLAWVPMKGLSFGISPVIEYGSLAMNDYFGGPDYGVTTDIAYGFEVGAAYQIAGVTIGLDYKSNVTHDFKDTFNSDLTGGVQSELDTPETIAFGVSYNFLKNHTVAVEYKNIRYGSAKGFEDFGWDNMDVYALGYEFDADSWGVRVGYNHGKQPIGLSPTTIPEFFGSFGSLTAFPAVTEDHYTIGGSYAFSKMTSVDASFVYGTGSAEADLSAVFGPGATVEAVNDQVSGTVALNYNF